MSQPSAGDSDVDPNPSGTGLRNEYNDIIQAILTKYSGAAAPLVTFPYMNFVDEGVTPTAWQIRNVADSDWIKLAEINATSIKLFSEGAAVVGLGNTAAFTAAQSIDVAGAAGVLALRSDLTTGIVASLDLGGENALAADIVAASLDARITAATAGAENAELDIGVIRGGAFTNRMTIGDLVRINGTLEADVLQQGDTDLDDIITDRLSSAGDGGDFTTDLSVISQLGCGQVYRFTGSVDRTVTIGSQPRTGSWIMVINDSGGAADLTFATAAAPNAVDFRGSGTSLAGVAGESPQCALTWFNDGARVNIDGDNV